MLAEGWWLTRTGRPRSEPEIRVDQVRELVARDRGPPFEARRRVFVIDDAHTMNDAAQNALLKSLEEPAAALARDPGLVARPGLRAHDPLALPARCASGRCRARSSSELLQRERGLAGDEAAELQAALAGGSLGGGALARAGRSELRMRDELVALLERVAGADALARMEAAEALEQAEDPALAAHDAALAAARPGGAARGGARRGAPQPRLAPSGSRRSRRGPLGRARGRAGRARREDAREALRGFASKLLTFDRAGERARRATDRPRACSSTGEPCALHRKPALELSRAPGIANPRATGGRAGRPDMNRKLIRPDLTEMKEHRDTDVTTPK